MLIIYLRSGLARTCGRVLRGWERTLFRPRSQVLGVLPLGWMQADEVSIFIKLKVETQSSKYIVFTFFCCGKCIQLGQVKPWATHFAAGGRKSVTNICIPGICCQWRIQGRGPGGPGPHLIFSEIAHFLWSAGIIFAEFNMHSQAGPLFSWRSGSATGCNWNSLEFR